MVTAFEWVGPRLTLASTSPRRKSLLAEAGIPYQAVAPHPHELEKRDVPHLEPSELAMVNAHRKARSVFKPKGRSAVIGVDTIVVFQGEVFGKPASIPEAHRMLGRLSGQVHQVISGVAILAPKAAPLLTCEVSSVEFLKLTKSQIQDYVARVPVLDKAGAYAAQEHADLIIAGIQGSISNVIGLPMELILSEFHAMGYLQLAD